MEHNVMSFLIIFLMCYNVHMGQAAELILGESPDENMVKDMVPCENDTDCDSYINGLCRNNFCECNGTKFCEDKGETIVTKIGEYCSIKADCNIEHSVCEKNKCACEKGRVEASDNRRCLTIAQALGSTCEESVQCYKKVPHSDCQHEECVCQDQMHEYHGACFRNGGLGDKCELLGECSLTPFAHCIENQCSCKDGYVQNKAANRCLEIPTKINGPCYEDLQCSTKFGKAFCKQGHCNCMELYQYKFTKGTCVGDVLLGEVCENHTDCHGLEQGERRSECVLGECKCKSEFREEHGFCTSGGIRHDLELPTILLFFILLLYTHYLRN